ncbi:MULTISPECIES: hypothetical protein [unclassified Beijerinckia]|uniref:hypothetical protein n=1 Tax=unclassified Beijerinckia TaxID=2638183 RepID=UPI00089B3425|nr:MULTISPECIES: hypothetical protein [unclassified Beijerinckia]MDH7796439.1 putative phage tail protein [Beijerinckia sp. GAS462]SEC45159.1 Phage-related protein, tail component [Beijerinckia sp. 28-YEA-48]
MTVHFHGSLRKLQADPIEVEAETPAEAIKIVTSQLPAFAPNAVKGRQCVQVAGCHKIEELFSTNPREEIHLMPAFIGGKSGGWLQIIIGAVLLVAAAAASFMGMPVIGSLLLKMGLLMLLGGVLQLIAAPKRDDKNSEEVKGHYLGSPKNTVDIGRRIPILYGKTQIGGHYLSFNISAAEV